MLRQIAIVATTLAVGSCIAGAEVFVEPQAPERGLEVVSNGEFDRGGRSYADAWRPLPGACRIHRVLRETGEHSLFLALRDDGDGGVMQTVTLPARRALSLRVLATCHTSTEAAVVVTLTRLTDGVVLAEVVIDGIERGVLAEGFDTGPGGPAELMVRLVGDAGSEALIDRVVIARPVRACEARPPDYAGTDLVLAQGQGLRVDADFRPRLLPQAAQMLQEAIEDVTGARTAEIGAGVSVSVSQPEATDWPQRESYRLKVGATGVTITASAEEGAFRGMMTLIDLIRPEPTGGARILAVDVEDRPALPWRIGMVANFADPANTARVLARLKLNMALVGYAREDCAGVMSELRSVGVEPVLSIEAPETDDVMGAMQDAVRRLGARYLLVTRPSAAVTAFAHEHADEVTVIVPVDVVATRPDDWSPDVVALLPVAPGEDPDLRRRWGEAGVRYVLAGPVALDAVVVERALEEHAACAECLGAMMRADTGRESAPKAADLAWRGLSSEE